jgi:hypothetical protein
MRRAFSEEPESSAHAFPRIPRVDPAAFCRDAKSCQGKACRGAAGYIVAVMRRIMRRPIGVSAVEHETRLRVAVFPEIKKGAALKVFEKCLIARGKRWALCCLGMRNGRRLRRERAD